MNLYNVETKEWEFLDVKPATGYMTHEEYVAANPVQIDMQELVKTLEQVGKDYIQKKLDDLAVNKNYDNILSAVSYASVESSFQAESIKLTKLRNACWEYIFDLFKNVQAGAFDITPYINMEDITDYSKIYEYIDENLPKYEDM